MIKHGCGITRRLAALSACVLTAVAIAAAALAGTGQAAPLSLSASANPTAITAHSPLLTYSVTPEIKRAVDENDTPNPLAAEPLYVRADPLIDQSLTDSRRAHNVRDANLLAKIALQPQALWLNGAPDEMASLRAMRVAAEKAHQEIVIVLYDIPGRDCGSYSAGGVTSPAVYRAWVRAVSEDLGTVDAGVIIEPDALSEQTCWSKSLRASNLSLIRYAAKTMSARPHTAVYLDAGNPIWHSPELMARRLRQVDVASVHGFIVDTASFAKTANAIAFGTAISRRVGGKHFVVDTSRSGDGPLMHNGVVEWCNPPGRALGPAPTTNTGLPLVDAFLWIKVPGESDGTCNGGPPSGTWWPSYALGLAARASW